MEGPFGRSFSRWEGHVSALGFISEFPSIHRSIKKLFTHFGKLQVLYFANLQGLDRRCFPFGETHVHILLI